MRPDPFHLPTAVRRAEEIRCAYAGSLSRILHVTTTDTQVGVIKGEKFTTLIFPGTASARDVITDLRCAKISWRAGRVHAGFRSAFNSVMTPLVNEIIPGTRLYLAGHSLGGALAMLCAYALLESGYPVIGVYTYGQPRVGNGPFARAYNEALGNRTWRIVNAGDPVTRMPWQLGTYRHAGIEVFLPRNGGLEIARPWWSRAADYVQTASAPETSEFVRLAAHSLDNYLRRLHGETRSNHA